MSNFFSLKYWQAISLLVVTSGTRVNRNTFLGSIWGLIQPFVHIVVIAYFFGFLLRQSTQVMVSNLVGALPLWNFMTQGLTQSSNSLVYREAIIKRAIISKTYFPISDVLSNLYQLVQSFIAMYAAMIIFYPEKFSWWIIFAPIMALPMVICVVVGGIACAFLTPYVRDIPRLIEVVLSVLYWTVPIIYPFNLIPESKRFLFDYHPIYALIRPVQDLVITGHLSTFEVIIKSWLVCIICIFVSFILYKRLARNVIYYL
jgi:lipopolysaccharide transport system permease protein